MNNRAMAAALVFGVAAVVAPAARSAGKAASFVCGGISQPEAESMKAQARDHDLMLTFAQASGAYLADVDVQISGPKGAVVVSGRCDGPIMLVDLPGSGTWRVTARVNGVERQKTISTKRGRTARATLVWPADGQ
jgi:hypothetical protein